MDNWQTMVVDSLKRIEKKLDSKVDNKVCSLKHSKAQEFKTWLSIILSIVALIGIVYTSFSYLEGSTIKDKVVSYGK